MSGGLAALEAVRAGERRDTLAAFLTLLGLTSGHMMLETGRDALFLARLPASQLPWTYLLVAGAGVLLAKLERKIAGKTTRFGVPIALVAGAAVDVVFWALAAKPAPALLYALYVYTGVFASWVTVEFWLLLGQRFNMMEAKRLYGVIGTGSVLGAVIGALIARTVATALPARHVLLGSAVAFVVTAFGPAFAFAQRVTAVEEPAPKSAVGPSIGTELRGLGNRPYVRRLLVLTLLSTLALGLVDYLFKAAAARALAPAELAPFFATVYAVLGAVALVAQLFGVSWLLRVLGVHRGLWVVPVLVAAAAAGGVAGAGMVAILVLKGIDGSLRYSLHRTTMELLYVPLPDAIRRRVKPFIDLVGQRGGQALMSVGILGAMWVGLGDSALVLLLLVLAILWLGAAVGLRQYYLDLFRATLREGSLGAHGELPALDLDALETLFGALNSARDAEVLAALDLLAEQQRARLIPALVLYHPSRAVVLRAFELIVREGRSDFVPIADRLVDHADMEVRTAAVRARAHAKPDEAFLRTQLEHECVHVAATALVALVSQGWEGFGDAENRVRTLSGGPIDVKRALARAIRFQPSPIFEAQLEEMADAGDPRLYPDVARAMAALKTERHLPALLPMLAHRDAELFVREAFAAVGAPAVDFLSRALADTALPHAVRRRIPRAMCDLDPEAVAPVLVRRLLEEPDGMVRYRILRALGRMRRLAPRLRFDRAALTKAAELTIDEAFRALGWRLALERAAAAEPALKTPAQELMVSLLADKEVHGTERVFRLLGLLHPSEDFARIFRGLRGIRSGSAKARASARELLENSLGRGELREKILLLVEEIPAEARLARSGTRALHEGAPYEAVLREVLESGGDTLRSLAAYHVGELGIASLRVDVETLRQRSGDEAAVSKLIQHARALLGASAKIPVPG